MPISSKMIFQTVSVRDVKRDKDFGEPNFALHGMGGIGAIPQFAKKPTATALSAGHSFAPSPWQNNLTRARPIDFLRALFERLRNCKTGEFTIVESLLNVLATNVFQVHHGGCQIFVPQPFLEFTNTTNIAFQVDGRKCVPELVQEPIAAIGPLGAAVAVPRCTGSAVQAGAPGDVFQLAFEILVRTACLGGKHQIVRVRSLLAVLVVFQRFQQCRWHWDLSLFLVLWLES